MTALLQERRVRVCMLRGNWKAQPSMDVLYRKTFKGSKRGPSNPRHVRNWIPEDPLPFSQPQQPVAQDSRAEGEVGATRPAVMRREPDGGPPGDYKIFEDSEYDDKNEKKGRRHLTYPCESERVTKDTTDIAEQNDKNHE